MSSPKLSVVIASNNGLPVLEECLNSLYQQPDYDVAEVIVAGRCGGINHNVIETKFPQVRLLRFEERKTIPELRGIGMSHAKGEIVAVTEDHCIVPADWFSQILKAHESGCAVIGGAVENACHKRILDWATFFCEYSRYINPVPDGAVTDLPENNVSYKRYVLGDVEDALRSGYWEGFAYKKMLQRGYKFLSVPSIVVYHKKSSGLSEFILQRYYYSRSFAGMRIHNVHILKRIFYINLSILLPVLLFTRSILCILRKKRFYKEFIMSSPLLLFFYIIWASGELAGYLFGPGDSLLKVE